MSQGLSRYVEDPILKDQQLASTWPRASTADNALAHGCAQSGRRYEPPKRAFVAAPEDVCIAARAIRVPTGPGPICRQRDYGKGSFA